MADSDLIDYADFVNKKIQYIKRYSDLIQAGQITPENLNHALASYSGINNWLVTEYEKESLKYDFTKCEFEAEWDVWFLASKDKLNSSRVSSKFASNNEIEAEARVSNRDEYLRWKKILIAQERSVSFYRRLLDNWKKQGDVLVTLSNNMRSEMKAIMVNDFANSDNNGVKRQKTRIQD
jgi:hypothetical protein